MEVKDFLDALAFDFGNEVKVSVAESHIAINLSAREYVHFRRWSKTSSHCYREDVINGIKSIPNFKSLESLTANNLWYLWLDKEISIYELRIRIKESCHPILCLFWLRFFPPFVLKREKQTISRRHQEILPSERQGDPAL